MIIRNNYYVTAHNGTVSIMRGIEGSLFGYPLQEQFRVGCLTNQSELRIIGLGGPQNGCQPLKVEFLRPSERAQVVAGLPTGNLGAAIEQMNNLVPGGLLPVCEPAPSSPPAPSPTTPPLTPSPVTELPPAPQEPGKDCRTAA